VTTVHRVASVARAVASKDLRIEMRSRVMTNQVLPFAAIVMVMFAFALDNDGILQRVAPGLVWMATLFTSLVVVQRSFAVEAADSAIDALRLAGVAPQGVYLGKVVALVAQLVVFEAVLSVLALILYRVNVDLHGTVLLVTTCILGSIGIASLAAVYGGLSVAGRGRETLLPLLLLPAVAPVLIGATRATESAFGSDGARVAEGWPWVGLLAVFGAIFLFGGTLGFGPLTDE
jgi:heme exporter protein B